MSAKSINLAQKLKGNLPSEPVAFMKLAGEVAVSQGQSLYVVGGVVRDLLLRKTNLDLDLMVEGDAIRLAQELMQVKGGKLITHPRFNTATILWDEWSVDIATARTETYARPGALPKTKPSSIREDLFRRDFTVNAMAVCLSPDRYGELIDLYDGIGDLKRKVIRILHDKSFIDDATRIWRAIRYEQRLGFSIEPHTLEPLKRDIPMLDTISGDRIRNELELMLKEEQPEKALRRAEELNVLAKVHPALQADEWLAEKLRATREHICKDVLSLDISFSLLTCRLSSGKVGEIISYLRIPKAIAKVMRDTIDILADEPKLGIAKLKPSRIYQLLHGYAPQALLVTSIATGSEAVRQHIDLYLDKLRYVRTSITGNDLLGMGVPAGPQVKEVLQKLLYARLDGRVTSKQGEEEMVEKMAKYAC